MPEASLDIAVIGLGTAGGAAALFLAREGHRVTLFERIPEETSAVGAGIMLGHRAGVLSRLGCSIEVLARGARVDLLRAETTRGRVLFELSYADVGPDVIGSVGLHRGMLFETLLAAVRRERYTSRLSVAIEAIARPLASARSPTHAEGG